VTLLSATLLSQERKRSLALHTIVLLWGVQAIVTQSLLLREAQVLMLGSELVWGVMLFALQVPEILAGRFRKLWPVLSWCQG
jgi:hypothetical protein